MPTPSNLARQYQRALRQHLETGLGASLLAAQGLGRRAVALGLGTLDVARIHEQALSRLSLPAAALVAHADLARRAGAFFARVMTPLERAHRAARDADLQLAQLKRLLGQRSRRLELSKRRLKVEVEKRRVAEGALSDSEHHYRRLLDQSRRMQDRLRLLSRQLLSAQEEERKKISRELHDVIAQTLTGISVRLATLKREAASNTQGIEQNIARTQELVQHSVKIVHRFARDLRPAVLDDLGLVPALRTFVTQFAAETGIGVRFTACRAADELDGENRTVLYRVAQEALTNAARHSRATQLQVRLQRIDGAVSMSIRDNGRGFCQDRPLRRSKRNGLGLLGMGERLEMVHGRLSIKSEPGHGTCVLARVPLPNGHERGTAAVGPLLRGGLKAAS